MPCLHDGHMEGSARRQAPAPEADGPGALCEEAVALAGAKGQHRAERTHHHWGTAPTELTFGGRRVQVRRPRVRRATGGEATLPGESRSAAVGPVHPGQ